MATGGRWNKHYWGKEMVSYTPGVGTDIRAALWETPHRILIKKITAPVIYTYIYTMEICIPKSQNIECSKCPWVEK